MYIKKEEWIHRKRGADYIGLAKRLSADPLVVRIMLNRNVKTFEEMKMFLYGSLDDLYDPHLLGDIDLAADILCEKIENGDKIRIVGDYDIDGVMSTYILEDALMSLGANVDHMIPDRVKDGYGLHEGIIKKAYEDGVDTIITCDNGISAFKEIGLAKQKGMTCIITDHHSVPFDEINGDRKYIIPEADAVINPKMPDCGYPVEGICGAVVALKLVQVLFETMEYGINDANDSTGGTNISNINTGKANIVSENISNTNTGSDEALNRYIIMSAIATIGDVMTLDKENRIIVKFGMKLFDAMAKEGVGSRYYNYGLCALRKCCDIGDIITVYNIGFRLGPCLNAAGRLDSAELSMKLLKSKSAEEAESIACELVSLNSARKEKTDTGLRLALKQIEQDHLYNNKVIVVYLPELHESVAGIVAGRIREKYGKPSYVITDSEDGLKGSGRSIEAYHMQEGLIKCKELLKQFGGHKLAAGLSLEKENLPLFIEKVNEVCDLEEDDFKEILTIDAKMPLFFPTIERISQFQALEPCGTGNPKPLFGITGLKLVDNKPGKNVGKYMVKDEEGRIFEVTYFGDEQEQMRFKNAFDTKGFADIAYYVDLNTFRGETRMQIIVKAFR